MKLLFLSAIAPILVLILFFISIIGTEAMAIIATMWFCDRIESIFLRVSIAIACQSLAWSAINIHSDVCTQLLEALKGAVTRMLQ